MRRANDIGKLHLKPNGQAKKTRRYVVIDGLGPESDLGVYNSNIGATARALSERYFLCKVGNEFVTPLQPKPNAFRRKSLCNFRSRVLEEMPSLPRMTLRETVSLYKGGKRKLYEHALRSLSERPLSKRDSELTAFVKFEKQNVIKAPRIICPRAPRYNLVLASYLKHSEHHFYKAINSVWNGQVATVMKGMDAFQQGRVAHLKWSRFNDPVAFSGDAIKHDVHTGRAALEFEHGYYTGLFPGQHPLVACLKQQLVTKGRAYCCDGKIKFKRDGVRCSGDINTSLGNCLIVCSLLWAWCHERGIDAECMNNGDDWVLIMERKDLARCMDGIETFFSDCGYRIEVESPVFEFEHINFCQTNPVFTINGWVMTRNHTVVRQKDIMCLVDVPSDAMLRKWLSAVGQCGQSQTYGMPVLQSWYRMLDCHEHFTEGFKQHIFKNTSQLTAMSKVVKDVTITPEARCSYWAAFGVLPDEQEVLERTYDAASIGGFNSVYSSQLRSSTPVALRVL